MSGVGFRKEYLDVTNNNDTNKTHKTLSQDALVDFIMDNSSDNVLGDDVWVDKIVIEGGAHHYFWGGDLVGLNRGMTFCPSGTKLKSSESGSGTIIGTFLILYIPG